MEDSVLKDSLELLQKYQINVLCSRPTEYRMMAKLQNLNDYDLTHLHSAVSVGVSH